MLSLNDVLIHIQAKPKSYFDQTKASVQINDGPIITQTIKYVTKLNPTTPTILTDAANPYKFFAGMPDAQVYSVGFTTNDATCSSLKLIVVASDGLDLTNKDLVSFSNTFAVNENLIITLKAQDFLSPSFSSTKYSDK